MLNPGLYEQIINRKIRQELAGQTAFAADIGPIDQAEASKVLAKYVGQIVEHGLADIAEDNDNLDQQIALANLIISLVQKKTGQNYYAENHIDQSGEQLLALIPKKDSPYAAKGNIDLSRPETSISRSTILTNAEHEPNFHQELAKEIQTCNRVDLLASFIRWSGLRLILEELREFTQNGGQLRVITTTYMGVTDYRTVTALNDLQNTEIRISYNTQATRLHAKSYIFHRNSGFSVAYVGSSNLSKAAMSDGLEWNVKVTAQDLPSVMKKIVGTFESYWNSPDFEIFTKEQLPKLKIALKNDQPITADNVSFFFDIKPYEFQKTILEKLAAEREVHHHYRNLVVAATGTGKTVNAAFDYKRFREQNPGKINRLLFVAHREEILKQSMACFRGVLRDPNFGELFVGGAEPDAINHLFMSIQTFNARDWTEHTSSDFYDFIVVDEFHHAAAPSYQILLTYYNPNILLGLTATPERMDGKDVTDYFDNRIAAEIRLPEAIDRRLLCPFQYFGVSDTVDLSTLKWSRGGYDRTELSNVYTMDRFTAKKRANMIITSIKKYVTDLNEVIGLGFCASVVHAEFMAEHFNYHDIPSLALTGESTKEERSTAKDLLTSKHIKFIFVVDLYNEGIDIPEVNTILFLRPTESLTIFLQQLGRGLRIAPGKEGLTVLDFIGQSHQKYNFDEKFSALLSNTRRGVEREIRDGFISLPRGSYIKLERVAKKHILENIKAGYDTRTGLLRKIQFFKEDSGLDLTLANFFNHYHINPKRLYHRDNFTRLAYETEDGKDFEEPLEKEITNGFFRVSDIDSRDWLTFIKSLFTNLETLEFDKLTVVEQRMVGMLEYTFWPNGFEQYGHNSRFESLMYLKESPLFPELKELIDYTFDKIDFVDKPLNISPDSPLSLHCQYTMKQLQMGLGYEKPQTQQAGVKYFADKKTDVFFITLNKSDKDYSPDTMYDDYSINENLFHWQSQNSTSPDSKVGQRYINHKQAGNRILLFVREYKLEYGMASPYTCLGFADYVSHEGSRPMSITLRMRESIPAKFLPKSNKLATG